MSLKFNVPDAPITQVVGVRSAVQLREQVRRMFGGILSVWLAGKCECM